MAASGRRRRSDGRQGSGRGRAQGCAPARAVRSRTTRGLPVPPQGAGRPGDAGRLAALRPLAVGALRGVCVQAALSLRLIRVNTAFQDEALYSWGATWSGRTGCTARASRSTRRTSRVPRCSTRRSGPSPTAQADWRVRDCCRWGSCWPPPRRCGNNVTAVRQAAAFFAAALWAVLGPTLHLGVFATYDAMSLGLLAVAAWCAVHAGPGVTRQDGWPPPRPPWSGQRDQIRLGAVDPVVVAIVILNAWPLPAGTKAALSRGAALAAYVTSGGILLVTIGGGYYEAGIGQTTLTRTSGTDSAMLILGDSWSWSAAVVVVALAGVAIGLLAEKSLHRTLILAVLAAAASLVPIERLYPHADLAGKARGLRCLVRGHRRGLRGHKLIGFWRRRAPPCSPQWSPPPWSNRSSAAPRRVSRSCSSGLTRPLYQAFGHLATAYPGPSWSRRRRSRVLPAARRPLAIVVQHAQRRAAQRAQHHAAVNEPETRGLRPVHPPRLLQPRRAGLLLHARSRP